MLQNFECQRLSREKESSIQDCSSEAEREQKKMRASDFKRILYFNRTVIQGSSFGKNYFGVLMSGCPGRNWMKTRLVGDFSGGKSLLLGFELSFVLKILCHQTKYTNSHRI